MAMSRTNKTCKVCKDPFTPFSSLHKACSPKCALALVKIERQREYKQKTTQLRRNFRETDIAFWKSKASQMCNKYIRARDGAKCISCGDRSGRQTHAGHFRTRGAASQLQFHWANINSQCARCNTFLSGNLVKYRERLIKKTSPQMVEYLENENSVYKWTLDDYKDVYWWFNLQKKALDEQTADL